MVNCRIPSYRHLNNYRLWKARLSGFVKLNYYRQIFLLAGKFFYGGNFFCQNAFFLCAENLLVWWNCGGGGSARQILR